MDKAHTESLSSPEQVPVDFRKLFERRQAPRSPLKMRATALDGGEDFVVENLGEIGFE